MSPFSTSSFYVAAIKSALCTSVINISSIIQKREVGEKKFPFLLPLESLCLSQSTEPM